MPDTDVETPPVETPPADGLGEAGKRAIAAERKAAKDAQRERDALAAKLEEFESRDKTEAQRTAERANAAETRAKTLEADLIRLTVAYEKGLSPQQAKRLVGATREELEADADELLETFKPAPKETEPPKVPDLDLGPRSLNGPVQTNPKLADLAQIEADLAKQKR